jgi:type I restriction enzyme, S subunit
MSAYKLRIPVQNSNTGVTVLTTEALYQACRYPHLPDLQRTIIEEKSPMAAKMKSKPHRTRNSRADWDQVRVKNMRWCLRVKLATRDKPIVEQSAKDDFWGAKVVDGATLTGMNVLGRLLMELRGEVKQAMQQENTDALRRVEPLEIEIFLLYGQPILAVDLRPKKIIAAA